MFVRNHGIAIIGFGGMGSRHAELIATVEGLNVRGIWDVLPERLDDARKLGLPVYGSFEKVLADPSVGIVLIATPNQLHKDLSIAALDAGKHVICEKPVALDAAELQAMIDAAERNDRLFVVHQNRRWDEDYQMARRIVQDKLIGPVYHVERRVMGSRGIPGDWRKYKAFGGGMLFDWGIHILDQTLDLFPEPVVSVFCELSYVLGNDCDDGCRISLKIASGLTAVVEVQTWNFITLPNWYLCGAGGTAMIDGFGRTGKICTLARFDRNEAKPIVTAAGLTKTMAPRIDDSVAETPVPRVEMDVTDYYRNVMDAIEGKADPIVANPQVMRVMKLLEACFESHRLGQAVPFERG
jgi:predicted dehydrogenase